MCCGASGVQRQVGGRGIIEATIERENIKHTTIIGATVTESYEKSPCIEVRIRSRSFAIC